MAHSVPACSFCHKNLDFPGNKSNFEHPETTVISVSCGHLFHRTCTEKLFGDEEVVSCKNKSCIENIERKCLEVVNFETVSSPDAPSVVKLEATINGYKLMTKTKNTKIAKLTTENHKLKDQITVKSSELKSIEKENLKLADENKKLLIINEDRNATIKKLKLHQLKLESLEKQNLQELQTKNDKCYETMEKLKLYKSRFENIENENLFYVNQIKEIQTKNDESMESIRKVYKSQLETVEKRNMQLIDQNNECNKTIKKLKLYSSRLETFLKHNLHFINQGIELRTKNIESIETIEETKITIDKTATNVKIVDFKQEHGVEIRKSESKIEIDKNLDEKIARVKMNYDNKNVVRTLLSDKIEIDKKPESPKVPPTVLRKIKSENNDYEIIELSDQTRNDAKFSLLTSGKSPVLHSNQKQGKSETMNENHQSPLFRRNLEKCEQQIVYPLGQPDEFSELLKFYSKNREVKMMEERKQRDAEESQICEIDRYIYKDRETKKRTWDKAQEREYDYGLKNGAKRHEVNLSSSEQEHLRPFLFTGHRFGPFSQVEYKGEYAYTSGEYLLLGDGVIYGILRTALQTYKYFDELLKKSPYNFARRSIRTLDRHLATLPCLPKKVMISIGDIDSATSDRSYLEIVEALQSLLKTAYEKGVKKIVMIPPVKHSKWHEHRYQLDFLLGIKAQTEFDWEYYYMQEVSNVMSEFTVQIQCGDTYYVNSEDNLKLTEKIANYTAGN